MLASRVAITEICSLGRRGPGSKYILEQFILINNLASVLILGLGGLIADRGKMAVHVVR